MPNEELIQRGYFADGEIRGEKFGGYSILNLGATSIRELQSVGFVTKPIIVIDYPFELYKAPQKAVSAKPDSLIYTEASGDKLLVANIEHKRPSELNNDKKIKKALEQALYVGASLDLAVSMVSDGTKWFYIDVSSSIAQKHLILHEESRILTPAVIESLLSDDSGASKNPAILAEKVWQAIWHATKEEPKQCLMTFVEIFILKFLSDNLTDSTLPAKYSFYELTKYDESDFKKNYGKTQIEYYVQDIRSTIKGIFKEKEVIAEGLANRMFGVPTVISSTSLINGFAFLRSSSTSLSTFNRTFVEILGYFEDFGGLQKIDPEFKLRLYETFLKKSVRQQKLGQFFTPRNIVKSIIKMAELHKLQDDSVVFDPACGVGGFILEPLIEENALIGNITFKNGKHQSRVKLIGADCDENTNILAKANMLIHLSECLKDPHSTVDSINKLMAETFVILNENQHLGTLERPAPETADIILTNPPYVTQGSRVYKEEITNSTELKNGVHLPDYYSKVGLGLESLFLRYISGALKKGGKAFVIVPQGLLTRTEGTTKERILEECNILASIALPRNTFYSTPQKTYILVLEKRIVDVAERPNVFCGIATSVGESLDARRVPLPHENVLDIVAQSFVKHSNGEEIEAPANPFVKIISPEHFQRDDRWDVYRFWSDDELVALGEREEAIQRISFLDEVKKRLEELTSEISTVESEILALTSGEMKKVTVADEVYFSVRRGKRVTRKDGDKNRGDIPVYSGSKDPKRPLCSVSESFAALKSIPIESKPIITVNANGAVGEVFLRNEKCIIHDDVMILEILNDSLDEEYCVHALRAAIAEGNYEYEAKLYNRVKELSFDVPVNSGGDLDIHLQKKIASAYKRFELLKQNIKEVGQWSGSARIRD